MLYIPPRTAFSLLRLGEPRKLKLYEASWPPRSFKLTVTANFKFRHISTVISTNPKSDNYLAQSLAEIGILMTSNDVKALR